MNAMTLAVQAIKDSVSALDAGKALGLEIRHGRCQCPLHGGHDFNCVLYPGNRGFYCHVCKEGGDCIKLVQKYHEMTFKDAVSWINRTFNLGMNLESANPGILKEAQRRHEQRAREREQQEWKEWMLFEMHLVAGDILRMLERQRDENAPKKPNEEWNWKFRVAVEQIPIWKRIADDAEMDCMKVRR